MFTDVFLHLLCLNHRTFADSVHLDQDHNAQYMLSNLRGFFLYLIATSAGIRESWQSPIILNNSMLVVLASAR